MICNLCNTRWAPLPPGYPYDFCVVESNERKKVYDNNDLVTCPGCREQLNSAMDYLKKIAFK